MPGFDLGIGSLITSGLDLASTAWQTNEQEKEAQANREFQEGARATQYQTAVKDMTAAGLNPAMMYDRGGGGAGTLVGSQASLPAPAQPGSDYLQAQVASAQAEKLRAEKLNVDADTLGKLKLPARIEAETKASFASAAQAQAHSDFVYKQLEMGLPAAQVSQINADILLKASQGDYTAQKQLQLWLESIPRVQRIKAQAMLSQLDIPEATRGAEVYEGAGGYGIKLGKELGGVASTARDIGIATRGLK